MKNCDRCRENASRGGRSITCFSSSFLLAAIWLTSRQICHQIVLRAVYKLAFAKKQIKKHVLKNRFISN